MNRAYLVLIVACAGLLMGAKYLTDGASHTPPSSGTYAYNSFMPGVVGFPAVGGAYTDPVFGGVVRRLTDNYTNSQAAGDYMYSHHMANANGSYVFSAQYRSGVFTLGFILNTATGAEVYTAQPTGSHPEDLAWHPTDPDKYYYFSGASLVRRNLAAQTNTTIKTFPATLQSVGGSVNWFDKTGRYMVIKYSDLIHVWDSVEDAIYSGTFTQVEPTNGWVGITPDGAYVVDVSGLTASPNRENQSRALNHATNAIGSAVQFWGIAGGHACLVSASNGKNYWIGFESHATAGVWRVDITLNQAGRTDAQQRADNTQLFPTTFDGTGHFSCVSLGTYSDWVFYDDEYYLDTFGSSPAWVAYAQEIAAVNVVTGEVRRLAHHRSRSPLASYYYTPRISSSWDGSVVLFTSNFNRSGTDYNDLYVMNSPLSGKSNFFKRKQ